MSISIVIFLLISMIVHAEETFDCTGYEDDSYHPIFDADDCRHYWHCIYVNTVYMHAVKRVCPAGTEFDVGLRQCETASLVDCGPIRSAHIPRSTSTTEAWRWKYSKLFSRINWKSTIPYFVTTRRHPVFDLGDFTDVQTTTMNIPEVQTTEEIQVLPFTHSKPNAALSLEQLSKNLHALMLNYHPSKSRHFGAKFYQPGEPENEAEGYASTTKRRTRRTRYSTQSTTLTTVLFTTEMTITTIAPTTTTTIPTTTTITNTSPLTSTPITTLITEPDTMITVLPPPRMNSGRYRRKNMTLYILTSDEHKIRQFSVNHTRGILINCNQLRRRLLGRRRRLRDTSPYTSTYNPPLLKNSSVSMHQSNLLLLNILFLFFLRN